MLTNSLKTISSLTGLKIVAAIIGLAYSVLQVRYFGATAGMDAYFVALTAVYVITSLVQGGQLAEVFLPEYLKLKNEQSADQAHRLFSAMMIRVIFFVLLFSILAYFAAPLLIQILGLGLSEEYQILATSFFRFALLLVSFTLFSAFVNATLNAEQVYGRTELTGLINSLLSLSLIIIFHKSVGLWILIYALLAGKIVELITGIFFLKKVGIKFYAIWKISDYNLNRYFRILFVTSGYVGSTQLYTSVLTAVTSLLPEGTLSIFNYVKQLSTKASGVILMPISTVFFSKFANLVSQKKSDLSSYLKKPLLAVSIIAGLMLALIMLMGNEILMLLWSNKTLSPSHFKLAYYILVMNFFGICFSSIGGIFRKSAISMGGAQSLYIRWIGVQLFCAIYSYFIITTFKHIGLITVLPINMFLMATVSTYSAYKNGIDVLYVFKSYMNNKFILFFVLLFGSVITALYFTISIIYNPLYSFLIKFTSISVLIFLLAIRFRHYIVSLYKTA